MYRDILRGNREALHLTFTDCLRVRMENLKGVRSWLTDAGSRTTSWYQRSQRTKYVIARAYGGAGGEKEVGQGQSG